MQLSWIVKVATICLILLLAATSALALEFLYPARIEKVLDGGTVVADLYLGLGVALNDQVIRLYGIDAWELEGEERTKGLLAKRYLEDRFKKAKGIAIEIRVDWGNRGKGKYGRWLGRIYVDKANINSEMVEKGHARRYLKSHNSITHRRG